MHRARHISAAKGYPEGITKAHNGVPDKPIQGLQQLRVSTRFVLPCY
jgi:hypothetical protein